MTLLANVALFAVVFRSHMFFVGVSSRGLLAWIIIGLLAGWIAGVITRGHGFGCLVNIILGLIGAVIGGWIFTRLGIPAWGFWASLAAATVGAVVLVAIGRLFAGGSSR
ncbi:MAG: GlsB/YeaQ/YmgE family stress response membrane protein [Candidatus Acidiferrales bacterium]